MNSKGTLRAVNVDDYADNKKRGREEFHYGFVNFSDGRRVAYTNEFGIILGRSGWMPITPTHLRLAKAILETSGLVDSAFPQPENAHE